MKEVLCIEQKVRRTAPYSLVFICYEWAEIFCGLIGLFNKYIATYRLTAKDRREAHPVLL